MEKIKIDKDFGPLCMPLALIGANTSGKPNFFACGWFTRVNEKPNIWIFCCDSARYTLMGVKENKTFSINYPSIDLIEKTDYCGIYSGADVDKSSLFEVFYGDLLTAPMVAECPLCMELYLLEIKELTFGCCVFGEVKNIYSEKRFLAGTQVDFEKINPFFLTMPDAAYRSAGKVLANAWDAGKKIP